jgi:hypothetical protein
MLCSDCLSGMAAQRISLALVPGPLLLLLLLL